MEYGACGARRPDGPRPVSWWATSGRDEQGSTDADKLGHWPSGVDDVDLAWALLGLGMLPPNQRGGGMGAQVMQGFAYEERGVVRVALLPGSPLSTWAVWNFLSVVLDLEPNAAEPHRTFADPDLIGSPGLWWAASRTRVSSAERAAEGAFWA